MTCFYIYAYLRSIDTKTAKAYTPYYIGKGKGNRAFSGFNHKKNNVTTPKDKTKIVIMETGLTEIGAFALERFYIRWYGRKDLGTGILRNLTDGGEGVSGIRLNEKRRKEISKSLKGKPKKPFTETHRQNLRESHLGVKKGPHSDEHKKKLSLSNRGQKRSEDTKTKLRQAWEKRRTK